MMMSTEARYSLSLHLGKTYLQFSKRVLNMALKSAGSGENQCA